MQVREAASGTLPNPTSINLTELWNTEKNPASIHTLWLPPAGLGASKLRMVWLGFLSVVLF